MEPVAVTPPPSPSAVKPDVAEEPIGETPDSVELYLNEIARYKLLRPEEEVQLAKEIKDEMDATLALEAAGLDVSLELDYDLPTLRRRVQLLEASAAMNVRPRGEG